MKAFLFLILFLLGIAAVDTPEAELIQEYTSAESEEGTMNHLSYQELAAILEEFGIDNLSAETIEELEESWKMYPEEALDSMNKVVMLLDYAGMGSIDYNTWEWTPTSDIVYSFHAESIDIDSMYKYLLQGLEAIGKGELAFTNVQQIDSNDDSARTVRFLLNGKNCEYKTAIGGDWYDIGIVEYINQILDEEGNDKKLYFTADMYGTAAVFYCDAEWAVNFMEKTGCILVKKVN